MPHPRQRFGADGEDAALAWYQQKGYRLVARNWRDGRRGELDLIVRKGRHLVVCEVKSRAGLGFGHPAEAVTRDKQQRIRRLTAAYLRANDVRPASIRFDVACILPGSIEVIEHAF